MNKRNIVMNKKYNVGNIVLLLTMAVISLFLNDDDNILPNDIYNFMVN